MEIIGFELLKIILSGKMIAIYIIHDNFKKLQGVIYMKYFRRIVAFLLVMAISFSYISFETDDVYAASKSCKYFKIAKDTYTTTVGKTLAIKATTVKGIKAKNIRVAYNENFVIIKSAVLKGTSLKVKIKAIKAGTTTLRIKVKDKSLSLKVKIKKGANTSPTTASKATTEKTKATEVKPTTTEKANANTTTEKASTTQVATTTEKATTTQVAATTEKANASANATEKATTTETATTTAKAATTEYPANAKEISISEFTRRVVKAFVEGKSSYTFTGVVTGYDNSESNISNALDEELEYVGVVGNYGVTGNYIRHCHKISITSSRSWKGEWSDKLKDYEYTYTYKVSWNESVVNNEAAVNQELSRIVNSLSLDKKSDIDKIRTVHDYIAGRFKYDQSNNDSSHNVYGALTTNTAVCQAYALLMSRLLNMVGVDTMYVPSSNHAWNLVKYNGLYYNVDSTYDDPITNYGDTINHDFYMLSDADIIRIDDTNSHNRMSKFLTERFTSTYPTAKVSL